MVLFLEVKVILKALKTIALAKVKASKIEISEKSKSKRK
jgi:hypothetical protein